MNLERRVWCDEAESGLKGAYGELTPRQLAQMVDAGSCELWRVNDDSWLVTGIEQDEKGKLLFVWSYAGKNLLDSSRAILRIARKNHIARVQFVCMRQSVARLIAPLNPVRIEIAGNGACLYEIGV